MAFKFDEINKLASSDPADFVESCEAGYGNKVHDTAIKIADRIKQSHIVLLSGPSGSGKTTTAMMIEKELKKLGIETKSVSMDNYFKTVDPENSPRNEKGEPDYESPKCLDIDLINEHIIELSKGNEVLIPKFNFAQQTRSDIKKPMRLAKNEIAIFEGIHALNDTITETVGELGFKLYISARSNIERNGETFFKGTWLRLIRRIVRDNNFRGSNAIFTLGLWESIRRGEKLYISPYKSKADIMLDSAHPCEVNIMKKHVIDLIKDVPEITPRFKEILQIPEHIADFVDIPDELLPGDSLLREFIGGGTFEY